MLKNTSELPPIDFKIPQCVDDIFGRGGGSAMGMSAVSSYLSCPENSRLRAMGVVRNKELIPLDDDEDYDLVGDALGFGTLIHALRATRIHAGQDVMMGVLESLKIDEETRLKAKSIWKFYDHFFPLSQDPFKYLGVECEIFTDIGDGRGGPLFRTVRYDSIIQMEDGALFSFECKTAARSGNSQLSQYGPQAFAHTALWNANPQLVAKYGPLRGTVYDLIVKTDVPKIERVGPKYIGKLMQQRAIEYMRLPEQVVYPRNADGSFARMLHSCWGRYRPCEYIDLCHEGMTNAYGIKPRAA